MSLILDALRKSERVRHQSLTGQLTAGETPAGPSRLPVPWVTLIALLLVANALLLFFFWPHAAPLPAPTPVVSAPAPQQTAYHPSVRPLAQETDDVVTPQAPAQAGVTAQAAPVSAPQIALSAAAPASIDNLPPEVRQSLPVLHMDVHGYAGNPRDRFVVINLKQYHIGDSVAEGLVLKDIVPQGAVLDYRGTLFLLPAT
jgi:general secretion pathway protein B